MWLLYGCLGQPFFEYAGLLRLSSGSSFGDIIGFTIFFSWYMHELHAFEVLLKLADLLKIGGHMAVFWRVALVGEVDQELRVAFYE